MIPTRLVLNRSATLGWIGLGQMGQPMAGHLFTKSVAAAKQAAGSAPPSMVICDPSDANAQAFVDFIAKTDPEAASRIKRVSTPAEVAKAAAHVHTMVPSTPQVEAVYLGEQGLVQGLQGVTGSLMADIKALPWLVDGPIEGTTDAHSLFVDHTTLDPVGSARVANSVHEQTNKAAFMVDGPVSGGTAGAIGGTLTIMYGQSDKIAGDLAKPLLQRMARPGRVIACGANGAGVGVKVANNLVLAINQIGLSEGLALGKALGVDEALLHDIFNTSTAQSWSSTVNPPIKGVPGPGDRDFNGGFQTKLMLKDVNLALAAGAGVSQPLPLTWASKSVYDAVCAEGQGEWATKDLAVVYEWLKKKRADGVEDGWKNGGPGDKQ